MTHRLVSAESGMIAGRAMAYGSPHFIVNPRSSSAATARRLEALRAEAPRRFPRSRWTPTTAAREAITLARTSALEGADVVVAVGGDGTINEVVNGLMDVPPERRPALGVVPAGSGSDFARMLRMPADPALTLDVLGRGQARQMDVGKIDCAPFGPASPGAVTRRYFINIAGCGASGRVVQRFNQRHVPGRLGYLVASVLTAIDYPWPEVDLTLDDSPADRTRLNLLFVCNGEYCGGGMHVGNGATPDDGLFQVVEVGGVSRLGAMLQWPQLYRGGLSRVRGARIRPARTLHVSSPQDVLVDCDGELCGRLPAVYTVVPSALAVCIP